jgi:hypothetical protein
MLTLLILIPILIPLLCVFLLVQHEGAARKSAAPLAGHFKVCCLNFSLCIVGVAAGRGIRAQPSRPHCTYNNLSYWSFQESMRIVGKQEMGWGARCLHQVPKEAFSPVQNSPG